MTGGPQKTYPPEIYRMDTKNYEKESWKPFVVDAMYLFICVGTFRFFFEKKMAIFKSRNHRRSDIHHFDSSSH